MSEPLDWREIVSAEVDAIPSVKQRGAAGIAQQGTDFRAPVHEMLIARARERRIAPGSYVRRATMAMLAHDLNLPLSYLLELDPRMSRETGFGVRDREGTAFGRWEIERLVGDRDVDPA